MTAPNPFKSFWMAGFECADHLNKKGVRQDMLGVTRHVELVASDYKRVAEIGISTVREGISWSQVELRPYHYSWEQVLPRVIAGRELGIQQVWDICHFGFPDDLSPLHPGFTARFESLCLAFLDFYRTHDPLGTLIITPINEVGFLSWLGGQAGETTPYYKNYGWEVKYSLMRAYIAGVSLLKRHDSNVLILSTEPLVNIVPPKVATAEEFWEASRANEDQFQVIRMLTGDMCSELGGDPSLLDVIGYNYYYNNQWLLDMGSFLPWTNEPFDSRWLPLHTLLQSASNRFPYPFILSETSHPGIDRPKWINFISGECAAVIDAQLPLLGVCLYPILDNPDWNDPNVWHHAGIWDKHGSNDRALYTPYYDAFQHGRRRLTRRHVAQNQPLHT